MLKGKSGPHEGSQGGSAVFFFARPALLGLTLKRHRERACGTSSPPPPGVDVDFLQTLCVLVMQHICISAAQ